MNSTASMSPGNSQLNSF